MLKRFLLIILICMLLLGGCKNKEKLNANKPITISLWHNYGGQMKITMDEMVDEFNDTVGKEKGIIINVTSISGSATLHDKLIMAANDEPNAPELPDITTLYPKTAQLLANKGILSDLGKQFTEEELNKYVKQFVFEGILQDGKLYVFPTAKSTEVLFLNMTLFNRFMKESDVTYENLNTFEEILKTAEKYYHWTDNQTPQIKNDGKSFITYDSLFNMAQIGFQQFDGFFLTDEELNLSSPLYENIWNLFYEPAVRGYVANYNGYGSDLIKTGDVCASIGSTAGVLFYSPEITYKDNITEKVEYLILPYPTFKEGKKIALQRGGGMSIIKSDEAKEYAAGIFLKWFTDPKQNLRFVASTGYLPVTTEAFDTIMSKENTIKDDNIKKLIRTTKLMYDEYSFYIPPVFEKYDELQSKYDEKLKQSASLSREEYITLLDTMKEEEAFKIVSENVYDEFIK